MAEAYGKKYLGNSVEIYSAGLEKHGLNPSMLKVLKEDNMNVTSLYSNTLEELKDINFDIVVTL